MTDMERYALQTGKMMKNPGGSQAETALDRYILAKIDMRRIILDKQDYDNAIKAAGEDIATAAYKALNKALKSV